MTGHARVQAGGTWGESLFLGVIDASDVAHELSHRVPVVEWRLESSLSDEPSRREDHEVNYGLPWIVALTSQHSEYAWVWVIIAY